MSDLSKPADAASWIAAARAARWDLRPPSHPGSLAMVADEQGRNLASIERTRERTGRVPTWCNLDEYRESVRMLRAAAARAAAEHAPLLA